MADEQGPIPQPAPEVPVVPTWPVLRQTDEVDVVDEPGASHEQRMTEEIFLGNIPKDWGSLDSKNPHHVTLSAAKTLHDWKFGVGDFDGSGCILLRREVDV